MNFLSKTSTVAVIAILILGCVGFLVYKNTKKATSTTASKPTETKPATTTPAVAE